MGLKVQFCEGLHLAKNQVCRRPTVLDPGSRIGAPATSGQRLVNASRNSEDEDYTPRHAKSSRTPPAAAINPKADAAEGCGSYGFRARGLSCSFGVQESRPRVLRATGLGMSA